MTKMLAQRQAQNIKETKTVYQKWLSDKYNDLKHSPNIAKVTIF